MSTIIPPIVKTAGPTGHPRAAEVATFLSEYHHFLPTAVTSTPSGLLQIEITDADVTEIASIVYALGSMGLGRVLLIQMTGGLRLIFPE